MPLHQSGLPPCDGVVTCARWLSIRISRPLRCNEPWSGEIVFAQLPASRAAKSQLCGGLFAQPMTASAAIAAVSARRMFGPSVTRRTKPWLSSASHSSLESPPSGPMMTPPACASAATLTRGWAPGRVSHAKSGRSGSHASSACNGAVSKRWSALRANLRPALLTSPTIFL